MLETPYSVTVTDGGGCQGVAEITIPSYPEPFFNFSPESPTVCKDGIVELEVFGDFNSVEWEDGSTSLTREIKFVDRGEQKLCYFMGKIVQ